MYAVFRTGGKQFRAEPGGLIKIPALNAEAGDAVSFDEVLMASSDGDLSVGTPLVKGAAVRAEVVSHGRHDKVIVFKRKRRKGFRKKQGHRQDYTEIRVDEIVL